MRLPTVIGKAELGTIRESIGAQLASSDSYGALERRTKNAERTENAHTEEQLVRGAARQALALALARALALTLPAAEAARQ